MYTKQRTLSILVLAVSLILSACAPGQLLGPAFTSTPAFTPTPAATATPAATSTPTLIAGIQAPITVTGAQLLIVLATNDTTKYNAGGFKIQTAADQIVLHVEAQIVSGKPDIKALSSGISLTDENGNKCSLVSYGNEKVFWEFMTPKAAKSLTLRFADGQTVKLDTILKIVP